MSVLSFRKSVDQLDQTAGQLAVLQGLVARCIETAGEYAVELKSEDARALRGNLEQLSSQVAQLSNPAEVARLQASFRGELRAYHDLAQADVARMRAEITSVIDSMRAFLAGVGGSTANLKETLHGEFTSLEATVESGDISAIREAVHRAVETAMCRCEEMERAQEFARAQLQDEIRNLHKLVDQERRAALSDPVTGVWNRSKLDDRIKDLILLNETFCIFFVGVPNQIHISRNDPRIGPAFLQALAGRLHSIAGKDGELGMTGRWSEEIFAIVFNLPLASAPVAPFAVQQALGGEYAIHLEGSTREIQVEVLVQAVERRKDSAEAAFYLQLGQAAFRVTAH